jgi:membrane protease YdiL (CAAX protease family)
MRIFLLFLALLGGSLLCAAAVTYPAWLLVSFVSVEPVHRVMNRVAMLFALIGLVLLTRQLGLSNRDSLGFDMPRGRFLQQIAVGWVCGVMLMLPLTSLLLGLDIRSVRPDKVDELFALVANGVLSGLVIAFIEEIFFRGVLFTAVRRTSGRIVAIVAPSLLYASLHFLGGKLSVPADQVSWIHGFAVLARLFERYADPIGLMDSFLALFMLGVLLSLVRERTGAIAGGIGLHAAGVASIFIIRAATVVNPNDAQAGWVGNYDGVIGWAAFVWFAAIALVVANWKKQQPSPA